MNTYKLKRIRETLDIYFENSSPMYPNAFENLINELAGEKITTYALPMGGIFGNFINTFVVEKDKEEIFFAKVLPHIGSNNGNKEATGLVVWNKNEEMEANLI